MLSGEAIICLSITPWESELPSTGHHLMRELARRNRVLFVDRPLTWKDLGHRPATPEAWARWRRTLGLAPRLRRGSDPAVDLWVLTPPPMSPNALPAALYDPLMDHAARGVRAAIRQAMRALGLRRPLLHINFELALGPRLMGTLGESFSVYHCFDEVSCAAHLARHGPAQERQLLHRADLVLATSPQLLTRCRELRPDTGYLPNGVEHAHYARTDVPVPPELAGLPRPVIGYLGNLEARFDYELVTRLARAHPGWSLVLVGPVQPEWRPAVQSLAALPNVHLLGPRAAAEAPGLLQGMDVAMIPFVATALTRAIYPLKLNEYLAAGRPVVLTPFAPLDDFAGTVEVAAGAEAFGQAIARALATDSPARRAARVELARRHDWSTRAAAYSELVLAGRAARCAAALEGAS